MPLLLYVKSCHKCYISETHLSFVSMLTMRLINIHLPPTPPQYTTYIAKIV